MNLGMPIKFLLFPWYDIELFSLNKLFLLNMFTFESCIKRCWLITFILTVSTVSINHSAPENSTISWLKWTKRTGFTGLTFRSSGQIPWSGGLSTSKINFFFTITNRIEVQCEVCLCILISRNESCRRNFPFSNKAAIEMFGKPHFAAMTEFPAYLH